MSWAKFKKMRFITLVFSKIDWQRRFNGDKEPFIILVRGQYFY